MRADSESRTIVVETMDFENANVQFKRIIRPLNSRLAPVEDWI